MKAGQRPPRQDGVPDRVPSPSRRACRFEPDSGKVGVPMETPARDFGRRGLTIAIRID
mgnify:CR=1 FL=1